MGYTHCDKNLPIQKRFKRKERIIQKRKHQSPYLRQFTKHIRNNNYGIFALNGPWYLGLKLKLGDRNKNKIFYGSDDRKFFL